MVHLWVKFVFPNSPAAVDAGPARTAAPSTPSPSPLTSRNVPQFVPDMRMASVGNQRKIRRMRPTRHASKSHVVHVVFVERPADSPQYTVGIRCIKGQGMVELSERDNESDVTSKIIVARHVPGMESI